MSSCCYIGHAFICALLPQNSFPDSSVGKESTCNAEDLGLILGLGKSPGEGKGYQLQYSCLENSVDLYSPWVRKELDRTERLSLSTSHKISTLPETALGKETTEKTGKTNLKGIYYCTFQIIEFQWI